MTGSLGDKNPFEVEEQFLQMTEEKLVPSSYIKKVPGFVLSPGEELSKLSYLWINATWTLASEKLCLLQVILSALSTPHGI